MRAVVVQCEPVTGVNNPPETPAYLAESYNTVFSLVSAWYTVLHVLQPISDRKQRERSSHCDTQRQ